MAASGGAIEVEASAMTPRALLAPLFLGLAGLPLSAVDVVDGVVISRGNAASLFDYAHVRAPLPDHNVVSILKDASTGGVRITVNGKSGVVTSTKYLYVSYYGGAGGYDQLTSNAAVATVYGDHNRVVSAAGGGVTATLMGDYNSIDATAAVAQYIVYGGAHNSYAGSVKLLNRYDTCTETAIPGVLVAGQGWVLSLFIASPRAQGNALSIAFDQSTKRTTVTENGLTATIDTLYFSTIYEGSWSGGDTYRGFGANLDLYGSGNDVKGEVNRAWIWGNGNTVASTGGIGIEADVYGTGETLSGFPDVEHRGDVTEFLPIGGGTTGGSTTGGGTTSGSTTGGGVTTSGATTGSGSTTGGGSTTTGSTTAGSTSSGTSSAGGGSTSAGAAGGSGSAGVPAPAGTSGSGGGGCGLGGALGALVLLLALRGRQVAGA
jgi:hypothetical protein